MTEPPPERAGHRRPTGAGGASVVLTEEDRSAIEDVLFRAQRLGFLGPAPIGPQVDHALRFATAVAAAAPSVGAAAAPSPALDLGSGGGLPALVLALAWPESRWQLVESMERRATALVEAVASLRLSERVEVVHERAELVGRDPARRGAMALVTARSFGPPATTAECGAPLLRPGGLLVVSDPPEGPGNRWPAQGLAAMGLEVVLHAHGCTVLAAAGLVPDELPRRVGIPAKRPRF